MKSGIVRLILSLAFLSIMAGASTATHPSTALAGSNGQQIHFSCPNTTYGWPQMDYAVIRGNNQNNQYVTWQGYAIRTTNSTYVFTSNWWWVGYVRIYWWNAHSNSWDSEQYYVPRQQNGNISYFTCPRRLW